MIACANCQTTNSADSLFCKRCGAPLPQAARDDASAQVAKTVASGQALLDGGRIEEARLIADAAVLEAPDSIEALSLKGDCLDRSGDLTGALECFEKVAALDPEAGLARLRLNQLRNRLALRATPRPGDRRQVVLIAAIVAVIFVAGVGSLLAVLLKPVRTETGSGTAALTSKAQEPVAQPFVVPAPTPTTKNADPAPAETTPDPSSTTPRPSPRAAELTAPTAAATGPEGQQGLPAPTESPRIAPTPLNPFPNLTVRPDGTTKAPADNSATPPPATDPEPKTDPKADATKAADPAMDTSVIDIHVSNPRPAPVGGAQVVPETNTLPMLLRVAANQYQLKRYDAAAKAYERALRAGSDPASTNQRLGQCYEHLGKSAQAVVAYERAVAALEASLAAGKGNPQRQRLALDSCRAAIKVLRGA
ncbi:MAG: tetratricopeptide repeat protein [Fimbriimonas ginsengisoli]|uniref:Tetratricopeptide repeat protein n=1 Tax=Fimbriimonas ginsengisoli TaxID=1005039 RepID=A0A931LYP7_FIMGI|nr:tetratricopeptide repeat protein [Fimbriimonas ginsengisoli]